MRIIEGAGSTSEPLVNDENDRLEVQAREKYEALNGMEHEQFLRGILMRAGTELDGWTDWLNQFNMLTGVTLRPQFSSGRSMQAEATVYPAPNGPGDALIVLPVKSIGRLLGIANHLAVTEADISRASAAAHLLMSEWEPHDHPVGMFQYSLDGRIEQLTTRVTLDALTLMYLHEVAHAFAGHLVCPLNRLSRSSWGRPMESQADYGAGVLFATGIPTVAQKLSDITAGSSQFLAQRMARGALALYAAFQIEFQYTPEYHRPPTRAICLLQGMDAAWQRSNTDRASEFSEAYDDICSRTIVFHAIAPDAIPGWTDVTAEVNEADRREYQQKTLPLIDMVLRKAVSSRWTPPF